MSVDLPEPDGPMIATNSPSSTISEMPSSATVSAPKAAVVDLREIVDDDHPTSSRAGSRRRRRQRRASAAAAAASAAENGEARCVSRSTTRRSRT